jgi:hypothetical protein
MSSFQRKLESKCVSVWISAKAFYLRACMSFIRLEFFSIRDDSYPKIVAFITAYGFQLALE